MPKYEFVQNEPRVGQTVIKMWKLSLLSEIYPEGFVPIRPQGTPPPPELVPPVPPVPAHLRYPGHPPAFTFGRIPAIGEASYSGYTDWSPDTILLACNTTTFPQPPPPHDHQLTNIFQDGYWGRMEYTLFPWRFDRHAPWLMYIRLEEGLLRQPLFQANRSMFWAPLVRTGFDNGYPMDPVQHEANYQTLTKALKDELHTFWTDLTRRVKHECTTVLRTRNHLNRDVLDSDLPWKVMDRAVQGWGRLLAGVRGWDHFVLVFRALERALLELQGFISWCNDVRSYPVPRDRGASPPNFRGSIFTSQEYDIFLAFAHMRIPCYLLNNTDPSLSNGLQRYTCVSPPCLVDGERLHASGMFIVYFTCISRSPLTLYR